MPLDDYLKNLFIPEVEKLGYQFQTHYPLPKLAKKYAEQDITTYFDHAAANYYAIGTEWKKDDGQAAFSSLVQTVTNFTDGQVQWQVSMQEVRTAQSIFREAVDEYLHSQTNVEINPQWVLKTAQEVGRDLALSQAKHNALMRQSQQAHWARMNAIQSRGAAATSLAKTYSEISDISHSGYMSRSNVTSAGHSSTIRAIGDQSLIASPSTGETYQVPSGSNHYWLNGSGEYIATDNALFDPRTNSALNQQDWTQFQIID